MSEENNAYILGTETAELHRLGLQHQVWASEACKGWELAGFTQGQTILDLGCGPGFCSTELAYITGTAGKVIGIDKSPSFIEFLDSVSTQYNLNITTQCTDFDAMVLADNSLDGVYARWAFAWISNPEVILRKLHKALKRGGVVVTHEYFDWLTFQTEPSLAGLNKGISAALQSLKDQPGNVNIGRKLPRLFENTGFEVIGTRPMTKMAIAKDITWHWPKSFLHIYLPKLVESGYLTTTEVRAALHDFDILEKQAGATILCPQMQEVIARKK